jgi:hypothetical protein
VFRRRQYQRRIRALPSIAGSEPQLSRTPQHTTHCKSHQSACDRANPCIRAKVYDCVRTLARSRAYASTSKNLLTHQTRRRAWACMNDIVLSTAHTHTHNHARVCISTHTCIQISCAVTCAHPRAHNIKDIRGTSGHRWHRAVIPLQ